MLNLGKLFKPGQTQICTSGVWAVAWLAVLGVGAPAEASVPLRRADIEQILNRVELIPRGRSARTARVADFLSIGDALRTAAASRAELRFNDGSLARVGERATFHFIPNTRNFRLSDGTMLLLIPPGRGRSTIQTPSAVTGIQGSALVVRHVESRNLTLVMALTNNPTGAMMVTLADCDRGAACTSEYALNAGQMALIQDQQVEILEFDLLQFYQTSPLIEGLDLTNPNSPVDLGAGANQVRQEIHEALEQYQPLDDNQSILLNPAMIGVSGTEASVAGQPWLLSPGSSPAGLTTDRVINPLPPGTLAEIFPSNPEADNQPGGVSELSPDASSAGQAPQAADPTPNIPESDPVGPGPGDEVSTPGDGSIPNIGDDLGSAGGGVDMPTPGDDNGSQAPGGDMETPLPADGVGDGGTPEPNGGGGNSGQPPNVNPGGGIDNPAQPDVNPGQGTVNNPAQPDVNPGGGIDNPGQPDVDPGPPNNDP